MRRLLATLALSSGALVAQQLVTPPDGDALFFPPLDSTGAPLSPAFTLHVGDAQYPDEAKLAGLEGTVLVSAAAAVNGTLSDFRVQRSLGLGLDERAVQVIANGNNDAGLTSGPVKTFAVDFNLPEKRSRWHLASIEFNPPQGVSRPTFLSASYPPGAGISVAAYDEGRILGAIGRAATAAVSFEIDESGFPGNFVVLNSSTDVWGPEAVMLLRTWRFRPGNRGGVAVTVPCTVKLLWGPTDFASSAIERQLTLMFPNVYPLPASALADRAAVAAPKPAK